MNEEHVTQQVEAQNNPAFIKIAGVVLLVIILLGVLAYAITPIRQSIISWWQDVEQAGKLHELAEFEKQRPQGDLTEEEKLRLLEE